MLYADALAEITKPTADLPYAASDAPEDHRGHPPAPPAPHHALTADQEAACGFLTASLGSGYEWHSALSDALQVSVSITYLPWSLYGDLVCLLEPRGDRWVARAGYSTDEIISEADTLNTLAMGLIGHIYWS